MKSSSTALCWLAFATVLLGLPPLASATDTALSWPHPIPCRIQDGSNPDLFVMTLGDVETRLADGVFDPVNDSVTLKDGTVRTNYYRDVLGVRFYQPLDKSQFPLPPSGICTWYYYYNRINETEVRRNADWLAKHLKDFGAEYVQIDDGWQGMTGREAWRDWTTVNPERFPSGMKALADHIRSVGLTPGIWLAPHGQSNPQVVSNHPGVFLLKPDGTTASDTWEGRYLVDPTNPETHAYLADLFQTLRGWGYDYFKIDGQPIVVGEYDQKQDYMMNRPEADGATLYRQTLDTIREAIGPESYLLGCWGIPLEGAGIMDGSRTGGDIVLGWGGFQVALRPTLQYYYLHNIVWYCDPDVMVVRSPLTLDQARVWAALQGLTGQALMTSDRLMDLSEDRVELLRRVYPAVDIRPLDLFPTERYKRIWDLKVNHLGRQYDVVGVFNFGEERAEQTSLKWDDLGLEGDQPVHVFDFWEKQYLGAWAEGMAVPVSPTSCRVLTLLPASDRIQLISTSRHMTQGWVDLISLDESEADESIRGISRVVADDPYQLTFAFPRGTNYVIEKAVVRAGLKRLSTKISNHQGWAVVEFTAPATRAVKWEVQFAPADFYHFPPSAPEGVAVQRVGLDGVKVTWREQYYLNAGYQLYLDEALQGYTPEASFVLHDLDAQADCKVQVRTVWEDGRESERAGEINFRLADLIPERLSLTQLEPLRSSGRWSGFEIEDLLSGGTLAVAGQSFEPALSAFGNSEAEFDVRGLFDRFQAQVGLNENSSTNATAEFVVMADGTEVWRSGAMGSSDPARMVDLDIRGVQKLSLQSRSERGRGRRQRTQVVWGQPVLSTTR